MKLEESRYDLSADGRGLRKYFRVEDGREVWYHVHREEMTEMERWLHRVLKTLLHERRRRRKRERNRKHKQKGTWTWM